MINKLDYDGIKFPVSKKDYCKIDKTIFVLMCFVIKVD